MSTHRGLRASLWRQRGLAMVEFAIAVPVLLLLMFGAADFGHMMIQYSELNDSVRNAARYVSGAALAGTDDTMKTGAAWTTLATQGANLAVFGNIAGTAPAVLPGLNTGQITVSENTANDTITVSAAYPYTSFFGFDVAMPTFSGGSISTTFSLKITTVMEAL